MPSRGKKKSVEIEYMKFEFHLVFEFTKSEYAGREFKIIYEKTTPMELESLKLEFHKSSFKDSVSTGNFFFLTNKKIRYHENPVP